MYIIEITEDKMDNLLINIKKGMHCFHKVMQCIEDMRDEDLEDEFEEYNKEYRIIHNPHRQRIVNRSNMNFPEKEKED